MAINIRVDGAQVILSNFGRLMNDPRHFDASRDVREMLDQGFTQFILELAGVPGLGKSGVGLLMTITRLIRQSGGEIVLARLSRGMVQLIEELRLEDYWDLFPTVQEAQAFFRPAGG